MKKMQINVILIKGEKNAVVILPADRKTLAEALCGIGSNISPNYLCANTAGTHRIFVGSGTEGRAFVSLIQNEDSLNRVNDLLKWYQRLPKKEQKKVDSELRAGVKSGEMVSLNAYIQLLLKHDTKTKCDYFFPIICSLNDIEEHDGKFAARYQRQIEVTLRDEQTKDMAEYFDYPNSAVAKLESAVWGVARFGGVLYGRVSAYLSAPFTKSEETEFIRWIEGQNSDGLGECFEQRPVQTENGHLYVSFWHSGTEYYVLNEKDFRTKILKV